MIINAHGLSMLPSILPESRLIVQPVKNSSIFPGEIICFIGEQKKLVSHRVVMIEKKRGDIHYFLRGDSQTIVESVPHEAVLYFVTNVEHPLLSYSTQNTLARILARTALEQPRTLRFIGQTIKGILHIRSSVKQFSFLRDAQRNLLKSSRQSLSLFSNNSPIQIAISSLISSLEEEASYNRYDEAELSEKLEAFSEQQSPMSRSQRLGIAVGLILGGSVPGPKPR